MLRFDCTSPVQGASRRLGAPSGRINLQLKAPIRRLHCCRATDASSDNYTSTNDQLSISRRALLAAVGTAPFVPGVALAEPTTDKVYIDVKVEGKDLGKIMIELFPDVSVGAARFKDLAIGKQGVGYRLKRVDGIYNNYLSFEGVANLNYSADLGSSPITSGDNLAPLEAELSSQTRKHDRGGLVSLVVVGEERKKQEKLIARDGKLVTITQEIGALPPNATQFIITRNAEPTLDSTNLIIGQVVDGSAEVVERIAAQPYAKPREGYWDKPFYSVAKAIGDKRADTAERGFNRPLRRVIIASSGVVQ